MRSFIFSSLVLTIAGVLLQHGVASDKGDQIKAKARDYIGSRRWLRDEDYGDLAGEGVNKCNLFVAHVLKECRADAPNRHWWFYSPIGAWEWANPDSSYLEDDACWSLCHSFQDGDVIATGGHVGIVTGDELTTSAASTASPPGKVVENDWGFRSGQDPTCWRYTC